jgi:hypothetical protein
MFLKIVWVEKNQAMFKFVYLGFKKDSKLGTKCIYDLEVLTSDRVNWEEYFTLSPDGLTHYKIDKMGIKEYSSLYLSITDFIPLVDWLKEKVIYDRIVTLGFFRNFRSRKAFKQWRTFVFYKHKRNSLYVSCLVIGSNVISFRLCYYIWYPRLDMLYCKLASCV